MYLVMCAGTFNLLFKRHIIFIQEAEMILEGLSAPALGGREASCLAKQALSHCCILMEK